MYGEIVFYTHGSTIEYGGEIFPAGELTADILNFTPEDYPPIQRLLDRMKDLAKQYEDTLDRGVWWEVNNQLMELRSQLMRYRVLQILLKEDDWFLNETQQYTESIPFSPTRKWMRRSAPRIGGCRCAGTRNRLFSS